MPEVSELAQYQQSTDALAPLLADQGTWFDPAPLPPRPPLVLVPERGADAWALSPLAAALPSVLQQLLATPARPPAVRPPSPALELSPLGQSSPVGVLGWELPGARPPPPVPRNPAGTWDPPRQLQDSTPLLTRGWEPAGAAPPAVPRVARGDFATPLGPGIVLPFWQPQDPGPRAPARAPVLSEQAQPWGAGIILPFLVMDPFARPPVVPAIPRPAPLSYPPGTIILPTVNASWGWEPRGELPRVVPPIRRFELATPPGSFLFPPSASVGWEPQGAVPRPIPGIERFEIAGPVGSPVVVLAPVGWEQGPVRPPAAARPPWLDAGLPPGFLILPWGWDPSVAKGTAPGAPRVAQDAVLPPLAVLLPYFAPDVAGRALVARAPSPLVQVPGSPIVVLGPTGWEPASPPPRRPAPAAPPGRFHGGADLGLLMPPPVLAVFLDVEPTLYRQRVRYPFELLVIPPTYPVLPAPALPTFPLPPPFVVQLVDEDGPVDLTGMTVVCRTQPADRTRAVRVEFADVVDALRGLVQKTWTEQDLRGVQTGDMLLQFVAFDGAGRPRTYPGGGRYYHQEITGRTQ